MYTVELYSPGGKRLSKDTGFYQQGQRVSPMTWGHNNPYPRVIIQIAGKCTKMKRWAGVDIQMRRGESTIMMYQEKMICGLRTVAIALAAEKALALSAQQGWMTIKIWTDSSILIRFSSEENDAPITLL